MRKSIFLTKPLVLKALELASTLEGASRLLDCSTAELQEAHHPVQDLLARSRLAQQLTPNPRRRVGTRHAD
jgi:hypothetical protein